MRRRQSMNKRLVTVTAALGLLAATAAPGGAQPGAFTTFTATFMIHFPKGHPASNAPCDPASFCGVGTVAGYKAATITILDETFDEIPGSPCLATTRVEQVDLQDGDGSFVIESAGTFCRPGGSGDSQAKDSSYGFPGRFDLRWTILGSDSSGAFEGASGGGEETMTVAGGIGVWHLNGAIAA
jgi:hypothetical protein